MTKPRVLIADDHVLVVEALRKMLEPEVDLVGAVENGWDLLEAAARLRPDVIVLDISMPLLNGIEAARQLQRTLPGTRLIFLTMHGDPTYVKEALRLGASGYVLKKSAFSELRTAIHEAMEGRTYVTPLVRQPGHLHRPSPEAPEALEGLTSRQREVLQLVAAGRSAKEIAFELRISVKTVEFHKCNISRRLDLHSTAELTKYAVKHHLAQL